jgi:hypothetical protein
MPPISLAEFLGVHTASVSLLDRFPTRRTNLPNSGRTICGRLDLTAGFVLPLLGLFHVGRVAGRLRASSRTKRRDNYSLKHCRYRYFDKLKWAEKFMDGELMFRSLSYYHQIEDGKVRGDPDEGSVSFQPKGGIITKENEPSFRIPDGNVIGQAFRTALPWRALL